MSEPIKGAQSFARNIAVLQLIADAGEPLSRVALQKQCGLTRPTLYRVIASLESERLIEATRDNRYKLGPRLVSLARQTLSQNDVRQAAASALAQLRDATGETVHLAVRSGNELVYVDKIESREVVRMASTVGTRVPFHSSGVGKAFMSAMAPSEAKDLVAQLDLAAITAYTTIKRTSLLKTIKASRKAGFVRDDQENEVGIVCFGAAICDRNERPVASVSVSVPMFRLASDTTRYSGPLVRAVKEISAELGFTPA